MNKKQLLLHDKNALYPFFQTFVLSLNTIDTTSLQPTKAFFLLFLIKVDGLEIFTGLTLAKTYKKS